MSNIPLWRRISKEKQFPNTPGDLQNLRTQTGITYVSESTLYFTKREIDIINRDAPEIVVKIRSGEWAAEVVTEAFIKAAITVRQPVL